MSLCECGCGAITTPGRKFRLGHWMKTPAGAARMSEIKTSGKPSDHGDGYRTVKPGFMQPHKLQHRVVAEQKIGRPLLDTEIIHHKDGDRGNNDPDNLVVCKDNSEHQLIHLQQRALAECGHADWRKCGFCKQWDAPENLYIPPNSGTTEHRECGRKYRAEWMRNRRSKLKQSEKGEAP